VDHFRQVATEHDDRFRAAASTTEFHVLNEHDLIAADERWLALVDWPAAFAKVWAILGWNIQLFHTQLLVIRPRRPVQPRVRTAGTRTTTA